MIKDNAIIIYNYCEKILIMMDKKNVRILYLGTPELSAKVLEKLITAGYNIIGVVAQCDKEKDRKGRLLEVPTKVVAKKYGIPLFQKEKIRLDFEFIKELNPDLILTLAYGQILPVELLNIPKLGSYNLHGSLLPKYRGAAPIQYALLNDEVVTGVTLMEMIKEMDAGKMFHKVWVPIDPKDNYTTLSEKMVDACYRAFDEGIEDVINGKNKGIEQIEKEVTFTSKITKELEVINFNDATNRIKNIVRALNNEPGTYFVYNSIKYKVGEVEIVVTNSKAEPGTIIQFDKQGFIIRCKTNAIKIVKIQKPGKKMLEYKDFYNGNARDFEVNTLITNE